MWPGCVLYQWAAFSYTHVFPAHPFIAGETGPERCHCFFRLPRVYALLRDRTRNPGMCRMMPS